MSLNDRLQPPPPPNSPPVNEIQIVFSIPTFLSAEQDRKLAFLIGEIVESPCNQPTEGVHWVSGYGSKPNWSQTDAAFLGLRPEPDAPEDGEPTYNDSIYQITTTARGFASDFERYKTKLERDQHPNPVPGLMPIDRRPGRRSYLQHDERVDRHPDGTILRDKSGSVYVRKDNAWFGYDFNKENGVCSPTYPMQVIWVPDMDICETCKGIEETYESCKACRRRGYILVKEETDAI